MEIAIGARRRVVFAGLVVVAAFGAGCAEDEVRVAKAPTTTGPPSTTSAPSVFAGAPAEPPRIVLPAGTDGLTIPDADIGPLATALDGLTEIPELALTKGAGVPPDAVVADGWGSGPPLILGYATDDEVDPSRVVAGVNAIAVESTERVPGLDGEEWRLRTQPVGNLTLVVACTLPSTVEGLTNCLLFLGLTRAEIEATLASMPAAAPTHFERPGTEFEHITVPTDLAPWRTMAERSASRYITIVDGPTTYEVQVSNAVAPVVVRDLLAPTTTPIFATQPADAWQRKTCRSTPSTVVCSWRLPSAGTLGHPDLGLSVWSDGARVDILKAADTRTEPPTARSAQQALDRMALIASSLTPTTLTEA